MTYKVENIIETKGSDIQRKIKLFIENTKITNLIAMNVWTNNERHYATIVYSDEIF